MAEQARDAKGRFAAAAAAGVAAQHAGEQASLEGTKEAHAHAAEMHKIASKEFTKIGLTSLAARHERATTWHRGQATDPSTLMTAWAKSKRS